MKPINIAVCISGELRNYKKTIPNTINFFKNYNVDYFLVYDQSEKTDDIININKLLKPKKTKSVVSLNECNNLNMWYKIKESYILCEQYQKNTGKNYDLVVRSRYDNYFTNSFDFNKLIIDNTTLYSGIANTFKLRFFQKIVMLFLGFQNDNFFFGTPIIMKRYCYFYDIIKNSVNNCLDIIFPETDFYNYISVYHNKIVILPIQVYLYKFYKNTIKASYNKSIKYFTWNEYIFKKSKIIIFFILFIFIYIRKSYNYY